ncbi:hypothetical protein DPEC_G00149830 [Dallia pectoralis]|uniref:Uncharacterized protein n=1 Tax=Dallia pectoralis TaxID=75939 RepID=A0ACC2GJ06_DALPE|nr:hypothetical protein DPEC_G00149830 [Dallia pectoralis]
MFTKEPGTQVTWGHELLSRCLGQVHLSTLKSMSTDHVQGQETAGVGGANDEEEWTQCYLRTVTWAPGRIVWQIRPGWKASFRAGLEVISPSLAPFQTTLVLLDLLSTVTFSCAAVSVCWALSD